MPLEIELKLSLSETDLNRLKHHLFLRRMSLARATTRKYINIYFDTPSLDLRQRKMALRLRKAGGVWLQTIKGGGGVKAGLHSRQEWETVAPNGRLDLIKLQAHGAPPIAESCQAELQPVFSTNFFRQVRRVKFYEADIELCFDSGEIIAGDRKRPISELELELLSGQPQQLFALALEILQIVPFKVEQVSKAEYGYRLLSHQPCVPRFPAFPDIAQLPISIAEFRSIATQYTGFIQSALNTALQLANSVERKQLLQVSHGLNLLISLALAWREDKNLKLLHDDLEDFNRRLNGIQICDDVLALNGEYGKSEAVITHSVQSSLSSLLGHFERWKESSAYQQLLLRLGFWLTRDDNNYAADVTPQNWELFLVSQLEQGIKSCTCSNLEIMDLAEVSQLQCTCKQMRSLLQFSGGSISQSMQHHYDEYLSKLKSELDEKARSLLLASLRKCSSQY